MAATDMYLSFYFLGSLLDFNLAHSSLEKKQLKVCLLYFSFYFFLYKYALINFIHYSTVNRRLIS